MANINRKGERTDRQEEGRLGAYCARVCLSPSLGSINDALERNWQYHIIIGQYLRNPEIHDVSFLNQSDFAVSVMVIF